MKEGWVLSHRKMFDNDYLDQKPWCRMAAWHYLFAMAAFEDTRVQRYGKKESTLLKRGQYYTSLKRLSKTWGWSRDKVRAYTLHLKNAQMIDILSDTHGMVITILNYDTYQSGKLKVRHTSRHSKQHTFDTLSTPNKEYSNSNKYNGEYKEIIDDLNIILGTNYKHSSAETRKLVTQRLDDGFTVGDFKTVHRKMNTAWGDDDRMCKYLRPATLYTSKFEQYLNIKVKEKKPRKMLGDK